MKLEKVAELVGGKLTGDGSVEISGISNIEQAQEGHITFLSKKKFLNALKGSPISAVLVKEAIDISISQISRDTYLTIPTKSTTGRPIQFYFDRQITPVLKLWPSPENSTDQFIYDRMVRLDDADVSIDTIDIPFRFYPCLAAGLAYYLALKRAPQRVQILKALYEEEFERAALEDRDKTSTFVVPSYPYLSATG